jgi:hypothetical protein
LYVPGAKKLQGAPAYFTLDVPTPLISFLVFDRAGASLPRGWHSDARSSRGSSVPRGLEQVEHFLGRESDHLIALVTDGTDFLDGHGNYGKVGHGFLPWIFEIRIAGKFNCGGNRSAVIFS